MQLELIKVKDSQGEILEKKVINNINIDLLSDNISISVKNIILRKDNIEIETNQYDHISIPGSSEIINNIFTKEEIDQINILKNDLLLTIKSIYDSKVEIV